MSEPLRAMMIGAHPDDVDICTCGITKRLVSKGCIVRFVSMTTGNAGHQTMRGEELIKTRAAEAQKSAAYLGATYEILPFDDGRLTPSLEARETLMRTIRNFKPDVIFTNRACDYHPDHRATGQLVQDCSYLMGVPAICPDTPVLRKTHEERVEYLRSTFNWDRGDVDEDVLACLTRQYGAEFAKTVRFAESWQVSEYGAPVSDALKELLIGLD